MKKVIISESQYKRLIETEEEQGILEIPNLKIFGKNNGVAWMRLQELLEKRGNPPYSIGGNLDLENTPIESLGNLTSVGGSLDLIETPIKSLGNLQSVGGYLDLGGTPISEKYSREEIRQMVNVGGNIYF